MLSTAIPTNLPPRSNDEVLHMWNQYGDIELLDWRFLYQVMFNRNTMSKYNEVLSQDLSAIETLLRKRLLIY